jgi:hypothetical protein
MRKKLIDGLLKINCQNNNKPDNKGRCHSKECMMNVDKEIAVNIQKDGCVIYKHLKEF